MQKVIFSEHEIRQRLNRLDPLIPWTHYFKLGNIETISLERDEKFFKKSVGLQKVAELALLTARLTLGNLGGRRVLDIASAEGGHSITMATSGATQVIGVEGRQLYVDRAKFVAEALGVENVLFEQADVRKLDRERLGEFDFVLCSGILHHLGADDFLGFLERVAELTADTMFLYTHVATTDAISRFRLRPCEKVAEKYEGFLFREHADDSTGKEKIRRVRASLDNTFSFWATEASLVQALMDVGFAFIAKMFQPHVFGAFADRNTRAIIIARRHGF